MNVNSESERERIIIYEETLDTLLEVSEKGILILYTLEYQNYSHS